MAFWYQIFLCNNHSKVVSHVNSVIWAQIWDECFTLKSNVNEES